METAYKGVTILYWFLCIKSLSVIKSVILCLTMTKYLDCFSYTGESVKSLSNLTVDPKQLNPIQMYKSVDPKILLNSQSKKSFYLFLLKIKILLKIKTWSQSPPSTNRK